MKQLLKPDPPYFPIFEAIRKSKHLESRSALKQLGPKVQSRYQTYTNKFDNNCLQQIRLARFTENEKSLLEDCYTKPTVPLRDLKRFLKANIPRIRRGICPYCGLDRPRTIDHYLPKALYPEFSVMALNLVPCCNSCNQKKGDDWIKSQARLILHFYLDQIPNCQFLHLRLKYNTGDTIPKVKFILRFPNSLPTNITDVINNHFKRLELLRQYDEEAGTAIEKVRSVIIDTFHSKNKKDIKLWLLKQARHNKKHFGKNYWETVILAAISNNDIFVSDMIKEM